MEREIRIRFIGDAKDMKRASQEAKESLKTLEQGANEMARATASSAEKAGGSIRSMASEIGKLAGALAGASAAAALFWKGINQNAQIESLQLGIAAIVSANETIKDASGKQVEGAAKLAVAQGQVASVFEKMKVDAINTTATLPQLAQGFQAALAPAMAIGLSLDDTRKLTVQMVQAMGAMSIPMDQMRSEINAILQANITNDSTLAKNLGITNEMVKSWQQQGVLVDKLQDKLKDFTAAGEAAGKTWEGLTSTLADKLGDIAGIATGDAFETLKKTLGGIGDKTFGKDAQNQARQWGVVINDGLLLAIQGAQVLSGILFSAANGWLKLFQQAHAIGAFGSANTHRREGIQGAISGLQSLSTTDELYGSVAQYRRFGTVSDAQAFANQSMGYQGYKMSPAIQDAMLANLKQFAQDNNYDTPKIMAEARRMGLPPEVVNKLRKGLSDVENLYTKSMVDLSTDLSGQAVAAYKANVGNYKATPNKPAAGGGGKVKAGKRGAPLPPSVDITMPDPGNGSWASMFDDDPTATKARDRQDFERWLKANSYGDPLSIGTSDDPLVKGMLAYQEWKKDEGERLGDQIAQVAGTIGNLAESAASGNLSMGSMLRGAGNVASMFGPPGMLASVGLNIFGAFADRADENNARLASDRKKGLARSQMAVSFGIGLEGGAEGDRDRALQSLAQQANALKEEFGSLTTEQEALVRAKEAEIKASYAAAKALEGVEKAKNRFGATVGEADLKEQLGLGKKTAQDVIGGLISSGMSGNFGALSDSKSMTTILDYYRMLQGNVNPNDPKSGIADPNDFYHKYFKNALGLDIGQSNLSDKGMLELLQNTLIPAMLQLKDLGAGVATGSISGAGTDNTLAFDAPQTRMITNNNSITVNTLAVTGDKASVRELARIIATEMSTMASQAV